MSVATPPSAEIDWYFDFISPYSYLAFEALPAALAAIEPAPVVRLRPVLFAGLLNHWGHMGPAEVAPKRRFTYEHCTWLADRHRIPMRAPRHHPFNPLPLLRAAIAAGKSDPRSRMSTSAVFRTASGLTVATHAATALPPTTAYGMPAPSRAAVERSNLSRTSCTASTILSRR